MYWGQTNAGTSLSNVPREEPKPKPLTAVDLIQKALRERGLPPVEVPNWSYAELIARGQGKDRAS